MGVSMDYQKKAVCTMGIVLINVIVFLYLSFQGMTESGSFILKHGGLYIPYMQQYGEYYRLVTSMFLHFGFAHLCNNMVILFFTGWNLELEIGKIKFLLIYFLGGIGGNLLSAVEEVWTGEYAVSAGASGAIFAVIGALLYIAIRNHGHIGNISGKGIIFMVFCSLYAGFTSTGVGNFAHIGGFVSGFLLAVLLYRKKDKKHSAGSYGGFYR